MFQIKPTKPIRPSRSNRTAIGRKTDPNRYTLVLIITKPIPIGSVTNLKKYRANQTAHTPRCNPSTWEAYKGSAKRKLQNKLSKILKIQEPK